MVQAHYASGDRRIVQQSPGGVTVNRPVSAGQRKVPFSPVPGAQKVTTGLSVTPLSLSSNAWLMSSKPYCLMSLSNGNLPAS